VPPAIDIQGMTRSAFILRAALAAGAAYGLGAVAPVVNRALAQGEAGSGETDGEIFRLALTLELLEAEFYRRALELDLGADARRLAELLDDHERQHVKRLRAVLDEIGEATRDEDGLRFRFQMNDEASFLALALTLEENGVAAYNGAAPLLQSREDLALAGSIVQVEARHVAAVRRTLGQNPAPLAFDKAKPLGEAVSDAVPYIAKL